jgi:hypothetical protein
MLLGVVWELVTDVSGRPVSHIFKGQDVHEKKSLTDLPLKATPIGFPNRRLRNYHSTLRNIPEERLSHLYRGGSPELCTELAFHSLANKKSQFYCVVYLERLGTEWYVRILELKNKNYIPKLIFSLFSCEPNLYLLNVVRKYEWQCLKCVV